MRRTDAMNPIVLHSPGIDFGEAHGAEEGQQMKPQTNAIPLDPFRAAFVLGDDLVFLLARSWGFGKGGLGLEKCRRHLGARGRDSGPSAKALACSGLLFLVLVRSWWL